MKRTESSSEGFDWQPENVEGADRGERLREFYETHLLEPALVAWSDVRTRLGLGIVGVYLLMALVAVLGLWRKPSTSQAPRYLVPLENMAYPLGTTPSGKDLMALTIHSTPEMLLLVTGGALWATSVAVVVGCLAGYKGGTVDDVLMSISDFVMAIPGLPLVIILAMAFSPDNAFLIGIIITINYWAGLGRTLRSQVLTIREKSYVEASRTMGVGTYGIVRHDVLPNLMPYVIVNAVFAARYTVFAAAGLYFLGVLPYTSENWGMTLNYAYQNSAMLRMATIHWLFVPMLAIMFLAMGFMLLGQGMDRIFNPRVRTRLAGESESLEAEEETGSPDLL